MSVLTSHGFVGICSGRMHVSFGVSTVLGTRLRSVPPATKSSQSKKKPLSVIRRLTTGIVPQTGHHEDPGKVLNRVTKPAFPRWRCLNYRVISKEKAMMLTQNRSEVQSRVNLPSVQVSQGKKLNTIKLGLFITLVVKHEMIYHVL